MSRLSWDVVGERFYETGVDRGVLYLTDRDGVAWSGLTSVNESSDGGDAKPFYLDGFKYVNIASSEEYTATIEAFSSPEAFDICDGTVSLSNGLSVTNQARKSFGLSYRTKIGNDIDGLSHGYKLHLVYNALSAPSDRANSTMSDSLDPNTFSWAITTIPPAIIGNKPTAHFVIDSRKTPTDLLTAIENLLYGVDSVGPRLVTAQELLDLFASEGPWL